MVVPRWAKLPLIPDISLRAVLKPRISVRMETLGSRQLIRSYHSKRLPMIVKLWKATESCCP